MTSRVVAACAALFLTGCATAGVAPKSALMQVEPGMTRAQVTGLLGEPGNRTFDGNAVALQYCKRAGLVADTDEYTTIWMRDGKVAGLTTKPQMIVLSSCDRYPAVDWGQVPPDLRIRVETAR